MIASIFLQPFMLKCSCNVLSFEVFVKNAQIDRKPPNLAVALFRSALWLSESCRRPFGGQYRSGITSGIKAVRNFCDASFRR